jgi:hypothetical protein
VRARVCVCEAQAVFCLCVRTANRIVQRRCVCALARDVADVHQGVPSARFGRSAREPSHEPAQTNLWRHLAFSLQCSHRGPQGAYPATRARTTSTPTTTLPCPHRDQLQLAMHTVGRSLCWTESPVCRQTQWTTRKRVRQLSPSINGRGRRRRCAHEPCRYCTSTTVVRDYRYTRRTFLAPGMVGVCQAPTQKGTTCSQPKPAAKTTTSNRNQQQRTRVADMISP